MAVAVGMLNALRTNQPMAAGAEPGRANVIACSRYLPGENGCAWATIRAMPGCGRRQLKDAYASGADARSDIGGGGVGAGPAGAGPAGSLPRHRALDRHRSRYDRSSACRRDKDR